MHPEQLVIRILGTKVTYFLRPSSYGVVKLGDRLANRSFLANVVVAKETLGSHARLPRPDAASGTSSHEWGVA